MDGIGDKIGGMIAAFISLAVIAIVVSNAANTTNVISAFFQGISNLIGVAISPVTGQAVSGLNAAGLTGGTWSNGSSGFALSTNQGGAGSSGNFIGGLVGGLMNSGGGGNAFGNIGGILGGLGGSGGGVDSAAFDVAAGAGDGAWAGSAGDVANIALDTVF